MCMWTITEVSRSRVSHTEKIEGKKVWGRGGGGGWMSIRKTVGGVPAALVMRLGEGGVENRECVIR